MSGIEPRIQKKSDSVTDSVAAANFHNHLQSGASSMEAPYEYASRFKSSHEIEGEIAEEVDSGHEMERGKGKAEKEKKKI